MENTPWKRIGITLTLLAGVASSLAACSTGKTSVSPATAPSSTATAGAYAPPCAASQLKLTASRGGIAMGQALIRYQFTNTSATVCSLKGYPNASMPGHSLKIEQVAIAYMWSNVPINTVELAPDASAYFAVQTQDAPIEPGLACVTASLTIYPPQSATGFPSSLKIINCDGVLYISPLVANESAL